MDVRDDTVVISAYTMRLQHTSNLPRGRMWNVKTENLRGSARGTPRLDVRSELDPIPAISSGRRPTPVRISAQFGSTGRKCAKSVSRHSELIDCPDKPGRVAEDRPDQVTRHHGATRSHEITTGKKWSRGRTQSLHTEYWPRKPRFLSKLS